MRRWVCLGLMFLVGVTFRPDDTAAQQADEGPLEVTAEVVEYERERDVYIARGNVVIEREGSRLTADWVTFHPVTRKGVASGNVVVVEDGDTLTADFLHFDVDTLEGVVFKGLLDSAESGFLLAGEEVRKTGPETYIFHEGEFTTCRCPEEGREPWEIQADRADVEIGGYGTARNTTFEILGVPVLWLPWMIYPLKTDRSSGFLFPDFNITDRSGFDVGVPFFWAARDNINVILTPRYLTKRGFKGNLDVDYVFGERSWGDLFAAYLPDDDEVNPDDASTPYDTDRWAVDWRHDQDLPWDMRFKAHWLATSDNAYVSDFLDLREYRDERFLESRAFVTKNLGALGQMGLVGSVWWADDQQNPDDQDRDDFLLQRLPQASLTGVARPFEVAGLRLVPSFDVDYIHFWRDEDPASVYPTADVVGDDLFLDTGIEAIPDGQERDSQGRIVTLDGDVIRPDGTVLTSEQVMEMFPDVELSTDGSMDNFPGGPEGDGVFEEGEPLGDKGHRVTLNPRLALPFRVADIFDIYPEIGYHGTFYQTDAQDFESRNLFTAQLDTSTRFQRQLTLPFSGLDASHVVEPHLGWTLISSVSQSDNPLFIPEPAVPQERLRQLELYNVTRDPSDRISSVNAITVALENRIYVRREEGRAQSLFADFVLSTQYAINDDEMGNLYFDGTFFPARGWRARTILGWDFNTSEISESLFRVGWASEAGHDLFVTYRFLRNPPRFFENFQFEDRFDEFEQGFEKVNQVDFRTRWAVTPHWGLTYRLRYSFEDEIFLSNGGGIEYISKCRCWAIRLEIEDDRQSGIEFGVRYTVIGLGDDEGAVRPFRGGGGGLLDSF